MVIGFVGARIDTALGYLDNPSHVVTSGCTGSLSNNYNSHGYVSDCFIREK